MIDLSKVLENPEVSAAEALSLLNEAVRTKQQKDGVSNPVESKRVKSDRNGPDGQIRYGRCFDCDEQNYYT